jgi:hypothetical protein
VKDMMSQIQNRDKFSYDVDSDPLFQQALASSMNSGKQAMQDTIGQASALTGGYGSTYATSAGNQAYNAFIEDAYDNLPQYYQMAREAYQMEGEEMYKQFGMLSELDDKEYNRNIAAYDATYQHRNRLYDESYNQFRDNKSDLFAMANLQISEHGQRVSDAYNYYSAASDYADSMYEREYNSWLDSVNMAWKEIEIFNNDAIADRDYNYTVDWNNKMHDYQVGRDKVNDAFKERELALDEKLTNAQIAKMNSSGSGGGGGGGGGGGNPATSKIPSQISSQAAKFKDNDARAEYLDGMVNSGYITQEQADYLYETYLPSGTKAYNERTYTVEDKGGWNWGGGIDKNAKVKDEYDNSYKLGDLWTEASKTMGKDEAEAWLIQLQKDLGISWRN